MILKNVNLTGPFCKMSKIVEIWYVVVTVVTVIKLECFGKYCQTRFGQEN